MLSIKKKENEKSSSSETSVSRTAAIFVDMDAIN